MTNQSLHDLVTGAENALAEALKRFHAVKDHLVAHERTGHPIGVGGPIPSANPNSPQAIAARERGEEAPEGGLADQRPLSQEHRGDPNDPNTTEATVEMRGQHEAPVVRDQHPPEGQRPQSLGGVDKNAPTEDAKAKDEREAEEDNEKTTANRRGKK